MTSRSLFEICELCGDPLLEEWRLTGSLGDKQQFHWTCWKELEAAERPINRVRARSQIEWQGDLYRRKYRKYKHKYGTLSKKKFESMISSREAISEMERGVNGVPGEFSIRDFTSYVDDYYEFKQDELKGYDFTDEVALRGKDGKDLIIKNQLMDFDKLVIKKGTFLYHGTLKGDFKPDHTRPLYLGFHPHISLFILTERYCDIEDPDKGKIVLERGGYLYQFELTADLVVANYTVEHGVGPIGYFPDVLSPENNSQHMCNHLIPCLSKVGSLIYDLKCEKQEGVNDLYQLILPGRYHEHLREVEKFSVDLYKLLDNKYPNSETSSEQFEAIMDGDGTE
jgi:hypothetical protein